MVRRTLEEHRVVASALVEVDGAQSAMPSVPLPSCVLAASWPALDLAIWHGFGGTVLARRLAASFPFLEDRSVVRNGSSSWYPGVFARDPNLHRPGQSGEENT